jgi:ABC-type nickel/cobalt efflux system permease component RcnA
LIDLSWVLNPSTGLSLTAIVGIAFILGVLHGLTPDEHTWPITFSYSIGSYSTRGGMKAGFTFSLGFTLQRALLTTLGFIGAAAIYKTYNLDGPVYIVVGAVMFVAGYYVLRGRYLHLPIDTLLGRKHHTGEAERFPMHEATNPVPLKMAAVHGLIAGWGFGAYASIITFILAPQVPSLIYAPLPGLAFGIGTMCMQIMLGSVFATVMHAKHLTIEQMKKIGRTTAGRALYYGGVAFAAIGALIILFPTLDAVGLSTGVPIPNVNVIGVSTVLVVSVVGVIGFGSMYRAYKEVVST